MAHKSIAEMMEAADLALGPISSKRVKRTTELLRKWKEKTASDAPKLDVASSVVSNEAGLMVQRAGDARVLTARADVVMGDCQTPSFDGVVGESRTEIDSLTNHLNGLFGRLHEASAVDARDADSGSHDTGNSDGKE